jgi:hypothetical protein
LYQAAVNFTTRTGAGLEVEQARYMYAKFVKNNMEMKQAIEQEQEDYERSSHRVRSRTKRNIFGSLISTLTGLATEEQLRAEHEAEKHLEQKVARMLSHEIDVEKSVELLNREVAHSMHDANRHMRHIRHDQFMDNMYWSRKEMHRVV